ncbi:MAG: hypothetical protein WBE41_00945 [Terracidiphilus sp.]
MTIDEVFQAVELPPSGPLPWDCEIGELGAGVYVAVAKDSLMECPLCPIKTEKLDSIDVELEKLLWVPGERILYIGQTTQSLRTRIRAMFRHDYVTGGNHHGGKSVHLLRSEIGLTVYWACDGDPEWSEARMLLSFLRRVGRLPFANRELPERAHLRRAKKV